MKTASKRWQPKNMTADERKAYDEQRRAAGRDKAKAALERLDSAIVNLVESDESFAEYLRVSGRMHGYSWGNRLLIWAQRPDAGLVAGFNRWRELDRPVRKGSKGIQILAPMVVKRDAGVENAGWQTADGTVGPDGKVSKVIGFRVAYVFSVNDTDGKPISTPTPVTVDDDSDRAHALVELLLAQANRQCFTTFADDLGGAYGRYTPSEKSIILLRGMPAGQTAKTLIHELAHHYAHKMDKNYADGEIVAESAAFVVASHYGLDTTQYSAPYVASWARGDIPRFRALLERTIKTAGEIINDGETCPRCLGAGCEECR